ncbi:DUF3311 domain-containing protein [Blastopirellula marina]|uniref:DUF3311 domain-containing protein n=1 Tax=Blastopirellula marina TaxID=124 RepID=A0A2S8F857_9BACT|nr:DUF3311 domain-containing protein [Blastopirellula marina]PQO28341.1 hypothetical protein C5Y98_25955 [Blastopirellula marina]PTL41881.1 DUF3311 domain-containing protein [Blastopirellula marina]
MRYVVWLLVVALIILHQDIWFWSDGTLVWGFMPITLLWQAGISLAASFVWFLATIFAWPTDLIEETKQEVKGGE